MPKRCCGVRLSRRAVRLCVCVCVVRSNDQFDWYHPYIVIRDVIREFVKLSDEVLIIGCGNSRESHPPLSSWWPRGRSH